MKDKVGYVVIDFDGSCCTHDYPYVGRDIGAQRVLKRLVENNNKLILFTMRSGDQLKEAVKWFSDNDIPLFGYKQTQLNPVGQNQTRPMVMFTWMMLVLDVH